MENIKKFKMKRLLVGLMALSLVFTSCEDFLDETSTIGLSSESLTDIVAMQALNAGAYNDLRNLTAYEHAQSTFTVRDCQARRNANWIPWAKWTTTSGIPNMFNRYSQCYTVFNKVNTVLNADIDNMYGTAAEKAAVKGDAYFLRAYALFYLNNWFTNPSGNSVPIVTTVLGTNDRVTRNTSAEVISQMESDIEAARTNLAISGGITSHSAATAVAARMYFYNKKYNLAYERANEVITDGGFTLEQNVADIYTKGRSSSEVIFAVVNNRAENTFGSAQIGLQIHQADEADGISSLNPNGVIGKLRSADPNDKRFTDLMTEEDGYIFTDGKYPTNDVDYIGIRLAEMYLTRAEANIMVNNTVTAADVSDVNVVKNRAGASDTVAGIPGASDMLEIIFNERSKELYNETGDRFFNTRRLQRDILNESGNGAIPYSTYNSVLYVLIPQTEIDIHNMTQ